MGMGLTVNPLDHWPAMCRLILYFETRYDQGLQSVYRVKKVFPVDFHFCKSSS